MHHPAQCPVTLLPRMEHPLSAGIAPFMLKDEHYFMALDDPEADAEGRSKPTEHFPVC